MLTKNLASSDLIKQRQARTIYSNYIVQQQKVAQGCAQRIDIQSGSGADNSASQLILLAEGAIFTSVSDRNRDLSNNSCPILTVAPAPAVDPYLTDKIYLALTTNADTYKAAATGSWIKVTQTEYNAVRTAVSNTTTVGAVDATMNLFYSSGIFGNLFAANRYNGTNTVAIPINTYFYAVAFVYTGTNNQANNRIYVNADSTLKNGFVQVGGTLPPTVVPSGTVTQYYILKGVSAVASSSKATSFAIYDTNTTNAGTNGVQISNGLSGAITTDYTSSASAPTASTNLSSSIAWVLGLQGLAASSVQWVT